MKDNNEEKGFLSNIKIEIKKKTEIKTDPFCRNVPKPWETANEKDSSLWSEDKEGYSKLLKWFNDVSTDSETYVNPYERNF